MNRKGRAKLNNKIARVKRERVSCPQEGKVFPEGSTMCDTCGEQLVQVGVVALVVEDCAKEKLH
jgi:rRNA maturation endonuclease Nob1